MRSGIDAMYYFITYNRRHIISAPPPETGIDCAPDYEPRAIKAYLGFTAVAALLLGQSAPAAVAAATAGATVLSARRDQSWQMKPLVAVGHIGTVATAAAGAATLAGAAGAGLVVRTAAALAIGTRKLYLRQWIMRPNERVAGQLGDQRQCYCRSVYPFRVRLFSVRVLALVLISATSCAGSIPSTGVTGLGDDSAVESSVEVDQPDDLPSEAEPGVTIVASAAAALETSCEMPCSSIVTIHDASGAEFERMDFDGYVDFSPLVSYPARMVLIEHMSGTVGKSGVVHLLDTQQVVASKLFELDEDYFGHLQLGVGGRWLAGVFSDRLVLADLETGETHLFEDTVNSGAPVVLAEHQGRLAIIYQARIDVLDAQGLAPIASVDLGEGEQLIGLSPSGSRLAVGMTELGSTALRVIDLDTDGVRELDVSGSIDGWFSEDKLLVTLDWTASLLDVETGTVGESIESRNGDFMSTFFYLPASVPWHISQLGEIIALTHIETGDRIEGAGLAGMFDGRSTVGSVMWVTAGQNQQDGIAVAMLDLLAGEIVLYEDANFGLTSTGEFRYSHDRRQVLIPRTTEPSVVLADGQISVLPGAGQGTFCDDETVVIASPAEAARYRYQSGDVVATVGPRAHVHCVS